MRWRIYEMVYLAAFTLGGLLSIGCGSPQMHSADVEPSLNRVASVVTDGQGVSWLRLSPPGLTLLRYEHGVFRNAFADFRTLAAVDAVARGRDGAALCLSNYDSGAGGGRSAADTITACGSMSKVIVSPKGFPQSGILAFAQTSDGSFWLGTADEGLVRVHNGVTEAVNAGLLHDRPGR